MDVAFLTKPRKLNQLFRWAGLLVPPLATVLIGYGAVQFSEGRNATRLDNVEKTLDKTLSRDEFQTWANEQKEMLRETNKKTDVLLTREEFRTFTQQQNDRFRELKEDLRKR